MATLKLINYELNGYKILNDTKGLVDKKNRKNETCAKMDTHKKKKINRSNFVTPV